MDQIILVGPDIQAGSYLLDALAKAKFPVTAALWLYNSETGHWRFRIASPVVDQKGLRGYRPFWKIYHQLPRAKQVDFFSLSFVSPTDPLIQALPKSRPIPAGLPGVRLQGPIAGTFVDDGYVYRIE